MKRYRLYYRKAGEVAWHYVDTYEGASLAWMGMRLARQQAPGCAVRLRDAAKHADVAEYVQADKVVLS